MGRILPTRSSSWRRASSPTSWAEFITKESPVLPIPSYPALCREDTTSWIHGRPSAHDEHSMIFCAITLMLTWFIFEHVTNSGGNA